MFWSLFDLHGHMLLIFVKLLQVGMSEEESSLAGASSYLFQSFLPICISLISFMSRSVIIHMCLAYFFIKINKVADQHIYLLYHCFVSMNFDREKDDDLLYTQSLL